MATSNPAENETLLRGVRVLVTRAATSVPALRLGLEQRGAVVIELPTVAIEPPADPVPLDRALIRLERYDWILFTSRNAVTAVWDRLSLLGLPHKLPGKIAAVGPSTASDLAARGATVSCTSVAGTAGDLALALVQHGMMGQRILLPLSDLARPDSPLTCVPPALRSRR